VQIVDGGGIGLDGPLDVYDTGVHGAAPLRPTMSDSILFVTGASGAGKTATLRRLAAAEPWAQRCHFFDSIGVPEPSERVARAGDGETWRTWATKRWVETLRASPEPIAILEGQTPPSCILDAVGRSAGVRYAIVLLDCSWAVREHRLSVLREQPELASADMLTWAKHLKREADALSVPVIDTTDRSIEATADAVLEHAFVLLGDDG